MLKKARWPSISDELLQKAERYREHARWLLTHFPQDGRWRTAGTQYQVKFESLSERELEILAYLATHLSGPEIAARLNISINTLKTHTKSIDGKLGVHGRNDAVVQAQDLGLLT